MTKKVIILVAIGVFCLFYTVDSARVPFRQIGTILSAQDSQILDIDQSDPTPQIGSGNPAAVYCTELGYKQDIITEADGSQHANCVFPDGSECDEWQFYMGSCGQEYSYCVINGYDIKTKQNSEYSAPYAVCLNDNQEIGSVTELMNLYDKIVKGSYKPTPEEILASQDTGSGSSRDLPDSFNWQDFQGQNFMTPVKDQSTCPLCWAFSAIGTSEGMYDIRNGASYNLDMSEQQIASSGGVGYCAGYGCVPGSSWNALNYIRDSGLVSETCFPYTNSGSTPCNLCTGWESQLKYITNKNTDIPSDTESIKDYIVNHGPVSINMAFDFGTIQWGDYDGNNIYRCDESDPGYDINHALVISGYNEVEGYWVVKNSYGTYWGQGNGDGYFNVGYGECNIQGSPTGVELDHQCGGYVYTQADATLNQDLVGCSNGLNIMADDITFDCDGHKISGTGTGNGINLNGRSNVKIQNCVIENFNTGINLVNSGNNEFVDNILVNNNSNAYEDVDSNSNVWNGVDTGNYWDDYATNPGWPVNYEIEGSGDGVDNKPYLDEADVTTFSNDLGTEELTFSGSDITRYVEIPKDNLAVEGNFEITGIVSYLANDDEYQDAWETTHSDLTSVTSPTSPAGGNYVGKIDMSLNCGGPSKTIAAVYPEYISFYYRWENETSYSEGAGVRLGGISGPSYDIAFFNKYGGYLRNGVTNIMPVSNDVWYLIELKNINWSSQTSDIWVNGEQKIVDVNFLQPAPNFRYVRMHGCEAVGKTMYIDNIVYDTSAFDNFEDGNTDDWERNSFYYPSMYGPEKAVDGSYDTKSMCTWGSYCDILENYDRDPSITSATWTFKYTLYSDAPAKANVECWNYDTSSYQEFYSCPYSNSACRSTQTKSADVPAACLSGSQLKVRTPMNGNGGGGFRLWESKVTWDEPMYPTNPEIEIGTDDNNPEWSYGGSFEQSNVATGDFSYALYKALNHGACDCTDCSLNGDTCSIPVKFHSQSGGILEYSNIVVSHASPFLDTDEDGVADVNDNCQTTYNPGQEDGDGDGYGDVCDNCEFTYNPGQEDGDGDLIGNVCDNCEFTYNPGQEDGDDDLVGDVCDNCEFINNPGQEDDDLDEVGDVCDNCQEDYNPTQLNSDEDVFGDACDNCYLIFNPAQGDLDTDTIGDACDYGDADYIKFFFANYTDTNDVNYDDVTGGGPCNQPGGCEYTDEETSYAFCNGPSWPNYCVYEGTCYQGDGSAIVDIDGADRHESMCVGFGWWDLDSGTELGYGYTPLPGIEVCEMGGYQWLEAESTAVGEYEWNYNNFSCCGDDENEYPWISDGLCYSTEEPTRKPQPVEISPLESAIDRIFSFFR